MLLSHSEKLQYVSLNAIIALANEYEKNQNRLYKENILAPLFRLLKQYQQLTHRALIVLVRAFGVLCIGMFRIIFFLNFEFFLKKKRCFTCIE